MSKSKQSNGKKQVILNQSQRQRQDLKNMKKIDVTYLKQQLHSLRDQLKYLINEKISIGKHIQICTDKYMTQSYQLERVTKAQQEEIIQLGNKLKLLKNTFGEAEVKKKKEYQDQIQTLYFKRQAQKQTQKRIQDNLHKKVQHLRTFKQRETDYLKTLSQLQSRQHMILQSHVSDINKIKHTFSTLRSQITQITNKQIQTINQSQLQKIRSNLSRQQQIKKENHIMEQEILLCQQEKEIVQNQCRLLGKEIGGNKESRFELGNQATETYQRSLRVIKLEGKITKLKEYLTDELARLEKQLKHMESSYNQAQKSTLQKIQKTKTTLSLKDRDLRKVKACSQMVLNQRSSLQSYLLQVFFQNPSIDYHDSSNINQLLRKLFIKINSKKTPVSYKNYMGYYQMAKSKQSLEASRDVK